jgi:hypothetical protein
MMTNDGANRVADLIIEKLKAEGVGGCSASHCTAQGCPAPPDHADDHKWIKRQRAAQATVTRQAQVVLVGSAITGIIVMVVLGIKAYFEKGGPTP